MQVGRKVSSQRMWDVLRRAVMSGSYKGDILPSDSAMYWESIFTPDVSSAASSPLKSPGFTYFSDPGPPDELLDGSSEEEGRKLPLIHLRTNLISIHPKMSKKLTRDAKTVLNPL